MNKHAASSERGNVLFYILVAVALLAALSLAVSQSGRGNVNKLTEEKARLYATDMIEYANIVAASVGQLRLRGCDSDEISFENDDVSGYTNANAPTDNTCHVFHLSGGGVDWKQTPAEAINDGNANHYFYNAANEVELIGTTCGTSACSELLMLVQDLSQQVCIQINNLLDVTNPADTPPTSANVNVSLPKFTGAFGYTDTMGDTAGDNVLAGKKAGCTLDASCGGNPDCYSFYRVLWSQ